MSEFHPYSEEDEKMRSYAASRVNHWQQTQEVKVTLTMRGPDKLAVGERAQYRMVVHNQSTAAITGIVKLKVPTEMEYKGKRGIWLLWNVALGTGTPGIFEQPVFFKSPKELVSLTPPASVPTGKPSL